MAAVKGLETSEPFKNEWMILRGSAARYYS